MDGDRGRDCGDDFDPIDLFLGVFDGPWVPWVAAALLAVAALGALERAARDAGGVEIYRCTPDKP